MAASLDGFVAREDGSVDWLETSDVFAGGKELSPEEVSAFLATIDCYVMGARTYELALGFEAEGLGWAYGETPTYVLTHREWPEARESVRFRSGDLAEVIAAQRAVHESIWVVGGSALVAECFRRELVDEVRVSVMPVLIGKGLPFFAGIETDLGLHLREVSAYKSGMVDLWYEVL